MLQSKKNSFNPNYSLKTPVLFLIFNRPETTQKVFTAIKKAKPPRLYVAADGPRVEKPDEAGQCALARSIATNVDWDCEVNVHGMVVQDNDLIHADRHGAVVIPEDVVAEIIDALDLMLRREKVILDVARGSDFSVEKLKDAWKQSSQIKE